MRKWLDSFQFERLIHYGALHFHYRNHPNFEILFRNYISRCTNMLYWLKIIMTNEMEFINDQWHTREFKLNKLKYNQRRILMISKHNLLHTVIYSLAFVWPLHFIHFKRFLFISDHLFYLIFLWALI